MTLSEALTTLALLIAAALVVTGVLAMLMPKLLGHGYGVPVEDGPARAYVRATGIRDVALGAVLGAAVWLNVIPLIAVLCGVGLVIALVDFAIAYHAGGRRFRLAHGFHAAGAVAFVLILAMALFAIGR